MGAEQTTVLTDHETRQRAVGHSSRRGRKLGLVVIRGVRESQEAHRLIF